MQPIRTDLYHYRPIDDSRPAQPFDFLFKSRYVVVDEPPLSYNFPAAYYVTRANFDGGAQYSVRVAYDLDTLGPSSLAPYKIQNYRSPDASTNPKFYREYIRRDVIATLKVKNNGGLTPRYINTGIEEDVANGTNDARYVGIIDGMHYAEFRPIGFSYTSITDREHINGVEILVSAIRAHPVNPQTSLVQHIECSFAVPRCSVSFYYKGRTMRIIISRRNLPRVQYIAARTVDLFERYEIPSTRPLEN